MKAGWKTLLIIATAIAFMGLFATFLISKAQEKNDSKKTELSNNSENGTVAGSTTIKSSDYIERLARAMSDKGMVLYGSYQCKDCEEQKELFKDASKYLDYVECDASGPNANPDECISQKIDSYPTWVYNGSKYVGKKSLAELAEIISFSE